MPLASSWSFLALSSSNKSCLHYITVSVIGSLCCSHYATTCHLVSGLEVSGVFTLHVSPSVGVAALPQVVTQEILKFIAQADVFHWKHECGAETKPSGLFFDLQPPCLLSLAATLFTSLRFNWIFSMLDIQFLRLGLIPLVWTTNYRPDLSCSTYFRITARSDALYSIIH